MKNDKSIKIMAKSAPQAQTEQGQTLDACVQTIIDDVLSGKQAEFLRNRVRARIIAIIGLYRAGPVLPPSTPTKCNKPVGIYYSCNLSKGHEEECEYVRLFPSAEESKTR